MKRKLSITLAAAMLSMTIAYSASAFASPGTVDRYVNFRSAPSTTSTILASLPPGTAVDVISKVNDYWLQIQVNGKVGYVSPSYITYSSTAAVEAPVSAPAPAPAASTAAANVIAKAQALKGITHYAYGVNQAPTRMDCSAFTKYVFGQNGITLKWGTAYQKYAGTYVSKSSLKPGDLVFFRVGTSTSIGHVGIYMGNSQFIHNSPSADGVTVSSMVSGYWADRYVTARRVIE